MGAGKGEEDFDLSIVFVRAGVVWIGVGTYEGPKHRGA
jgi:hypothetical protein